MTGGRLVEGGRAAGRCYCTVEQQNHATGRFKFSQGVGLWESYQSHCPSENPNDWFQISPGRVGQILLSNSPTKPCKQGMDVEVGDAGIYDIAYILSLAGAATSIIFVMTKVLSR